MSHVIVRRRCRSLSSLVVVDEVLNQAFSSQRARTLWNNKPQRRHCLTDNDETAVVCLSGAGTHTSLEVTHR